MRWAIRSETRLLLFVVSTWACTHLVHAQNWMRGRCRVASCQSTKTYLICRVVKDVYWPLCTFPQIDAAIVSSVVYLFHDLFASFFFVSSLSRLCRGRRAPRCVNLNSEFFHRTALGESTSRLNGTAYGSESCHAHGAHVTAQYESHRGQLHSILGCPGV